MIIIIIMHGHEHYNYLAWHLFLIGYRLSLLELLIDQSWLSYDNNT